MMILITDAREYVVKQTFFICNYFPHFNFNNIHQYIFNKLAFMFTIKNFEKYWKLEEF